MEAITIVEIDVPYCTLTYGVSPCEAVLGTTGERKCFNSRRTCQDPANFSPSPLTLRFMRPSAHVDSFDGIPCLSSVKVTPQVINPGVDLGKRESVQVQLEDMLHTDAGLDKYLDERDYNPLQRGTFWGRFRARFPSLRGAPLRIKRGIVGQDPADMTTWHYVVDSTAGPAGGVYTITAKDVLKLANGDRAQAPRPNSGRLLAALGTGTGSLTLTPAGIGDLEYPASGKVNIGGSEICSFSRSGDIMSLGRGQSDTDAVEHKADERVQVVLEYESETAADIIYDLLTNYTDIDTSWIPLTDWQTEVDTYLGRLYSAEIAEPTDVDKLCNEIIEQAGLVVWSDPLAQLVRLTVLRPTVISTAVVDGERIIEGTYSSMEQPGKRVSQVLTFYGLRNPLLRLNERSSYAGIAFDIDPDAEDEYDGAAIKQVFSRWIVQSNRSAAQRLNELLLARYRDPPRKMAFDLFRTDPSVPELGRGALITHHELQDETGAQETSPIQITSVEPRDEGWAFTAEEMLLSDFSGGDKSVLIDRDMFNINLRDLFDELFSEPQPYDTITFIINEDVKVGSYILGEADRFPSLYPNGRRPALDVGQWPELVNLVLIVHGRVQGMGGYGGGWNHATLPAEEKYRGGHGSDAIWTTYPITIENHGEIWGGGGGGGAGDDFTDPVSAQDYGGGGAGYSNKRFQPEGYPHNPYGDGSGGTHGGPTGDPVYNQGSTEVGGNGQTGAGDGGGPGLAGEVGSQGAGGDPGAAIDGAQFVTFTVTGDVRGPQVDTVMITSITPSSVVAGGGDVLLTVRGVNFDAGATLVYRQVFTETDLATTFIDSTRLTATLPAAIVADPTTYTLWVRNSDDSESPIKHFTVTAS